MARSQVHAGLKKINGGEKLMNLGQARELEYQRELLAYDEKQALAELEVSKAAERVKELAYERARFALDWMNGKLLEAMKPPAGQPHP
jgi:hypothetical protein